MSNAKKIGILGGSFDPVHEGHVALGVQARSQLGLDEIWLLIDETPRGKTTRTPYYDRLAMAKLAIAGYDFIIVDKLKMQQTGRNHDHSTIIELKNLYPDHEFSLILGMDAMLRFPQWDAPEIFCDHVDFAIAERVPHSSDLVESILADLGPVAEKFRYSFIDFEDMPVSSTHIRAQFSENQAAPHLHPDVVRYISERNLYAVT